MAVQRAKQMDEKIDKAGVNISWCFTNKNRCIARWKDLTENKIITLKLFDKCIESILKQQLPDEHWQICVSDWMSTDVDVEQHLSKLIQINKLAQVDLSIKIINEPDKFSRGKGLNQAAELATMDLLFFIDTDMLLTNRNVLDDACEITSRGMAYFPKCCKYSDPGHTDCWKGPPYGAGMLVITTDLFHSKPGGWKTYYRWGDEDNEIYHHYRKLGLMERSDPGGFFHQWHPPDARKANFPRYKHEHKYEPYLEAD